MSRLYLRSPAPPFHTADGPTLTNSTAALDISPTPTIVPSAFTLIEAGMEFEINAYGEFSSAASAQGNLTLGVYWGGVAGGTGLGVLAATAATAMTASAASWPWQLYYRGRWRSVGSTGSIKGEGYVNLGTSLTAATTVQMPATAAARTVSSLDTTGAKAAALTIGATFSAASASNIVICYDISVDIAN